MRSVADRFLPAYHRSKEAYLYSAEARGGYADDKMY